MDEQGRGPCAVTGACGVRGSWVRILIGIWRVSRACWGRWGGVQLEGGKELIFGGRGRDVSEAMNMNK